VVRCPSRHLRLGADRCRLARLAFLRLAARQAAGKAGEIQTLAKKVLVFVAAAAAAPLLPWWLPVGAPPHEFWTILARLRVPAAVCAWGAVAFVLALLCAHRGTRDALLGHGKVLSLVSLGILCAVLAATLVGWSLA
jgi:hypothetical protein